MVTKEGVASSLPLLVGKVKLLANMALPWALFEEEEEEVTWHFSQGNKAVQD